MIAAFVTFTGTNSRGETIAKGWQRVLGTVGGVVAGVAIASLVGSDKVLALVLVMVCIFMAFYFSQIAYSLMIFWITTMLALLYGLMGQFSVGLLGLRLEETLVGAAIGAAVAFFVFPVRTQDVVRKNIAHSLGDLHDIMQTVTDGKADRAKLSTEVRDLDKTLQGLRKSARPLLFTPFLRRHEHDSQFWVRQLTGCAYYGRQLARQDIRWNKLPSDLFKAAHKISQSLQHNITMLAHLIEDERKSEHGSYQHVSSRLDELDEALGSYWKIKASARPADFHKIAAYAYLVRRIDELFSNLKKSL